LPTPEELPSGTYQMWTVMFDTLDDEARASIRSQLSALDRQPKISVIMPVYNPPAEMLRAAIESVRGQLYKDWEMCIADDCSTDESVRQLLDDYAVSDDRIKVIHRKENGHISAASNT